MITPRQRTAAWVVGIINSCQTHLHLQTAKRVIEQFQKLHDQKEELPLMRWYRQKEFELQVLSQNS